MLREGQAMMTIDNAAQGIRERLGPKVPCLRPSQLRMADT